jgi:hypothetical protein
MLVAVALLVAVVSAVATVVTPPAPAAASGLTSVSAGAYHTCAITPDGTLACWRNNSDGQATPPSGTFTHVSAGIFFTCAIKTDGTLSCQGDNSYKQLGADVEITSAPPTNPGSGPYTVTYSATGGPAPTFTLASGSFPPDISLSSDGTLSGSLTTPLGLVQLAERMHNPRMKASAINSDILLVNTQRERGLTAQGSDTLIRLARAR